MRVLFFCVLNAFSTVYNSTSFSGRHDHTFAFVPVVQTKQAQIESQYDEGSMM